MLELFYDQDDNEFYDGEGECEPDFDSPLEDDAVMERVSAKCIPQATLPRRWMDGRA